MQILIFDQDELEDYAMEEHTLESIVITVGNPGLPKPFIYPSDRNGIQNILALTFTNDEDVTCETAIKEQDVEAIYKFIIDFIADVDAVILQSQYTTDIAAGIAKALIEFFEISASEIQDRYKKNFLSEIWVHVPNMLVYQRVLDKFNDALKSAEEASEE